MTMDIDDVQGIFTLLSLVVFIGIVIWAWSSKRARAFDEAAKLPFAEDAPPTPPERTDRQGENTHKEMP